jgi:hypothetical protein
MIKPKQCGCYGLEHRSSCVEYVKPKLEPVDKYTVERFVKTGIGMAVWNAALDAAAKRCDEVLECIAAARIRELKK